MKTRASTQKQRPIDLNQEQKPQKTSLKKEAQKNVQGIDSSSVQFQSSQDVSNIQQKKQPFKKVLGKKERMKIKKESKRQRNQNVSENLSIPSKTRSAAKKKEMADREPPQKKLAAKHIILDEEDSKKSEYEIQALICPICGHFLASATQAGCGHCFCELCLQIYFFRYAQCPLCEQEIRGKKLYGVKKTDQIVEEYIRSLDDQRCLTQYIRRMKQVKQIRAQKKVQKFEVGEQIDVRDELYNWYQGLIVRKHTKRQNEQRITRAVTINYSGKHEQFDVASDRLASLGTYTNHPLMSKNVRTLMIELSDISDESDQSEKEDVNYEEQKSGN